MTPARATMEAAEAPAPVGDSGWSAPAASRLQPELLLSAYWGLVRRQRWWILTGVAVVTAATALISLMMPKIYESAALVRVDPAGQQQLGSTQPSEISVSGLELMTTEARVITSPTVVADVIRQARLAQDPEFNPLAGRGQAPAPGAAIDEKLLTRVTSAISVSQPANSFLLAVSFRSHSPELSAQVANLLVQSFSNLEYKSRSEALRDSSRYMQGALDDLRSEMETSQRDLVDYESQNDVLNPDDKTNIMQARLTQLNKAYNDAQVARVQLQADYEIVQSGNLDALLASDRGSLLLPHQRQLQEDQRKLLQLGQIYGPNYPLYQQQAAVVQADGQVLKDQEEHVAAQIGTEYATLSHQENLLGQLLQAQKRAMDQFNRKAIRYRALDAKATSLSTLYNDLQQRVQDATVGAGLHTEELRLISAARPNPKPVSPRPVLATVLAAAAATLLGCGAAVVMGLLDRTCNSEEDVERWLHVPALGAVPEMGTASPRALLQSGHSAGSNAADLKAVSGFQEAVLSLRSTLRLAAAERLPCIALCSSMPGEGKSTLSACLAQAFAALGERVVLVDGDLRRSQVHRIFQAANREGLSSVLRGRCSLHEALIPSGVSGLTLLPAGPAAGQATELLHQGLEEVITQLCSQFDRVLIDCPPVLGLADMQAIARVANGVLLVVRAGLTYREHVSGSLRHLANAHANLLGVVLNGVHKNRSSYYDYYETQYGSEAGEDPAAGA
jgi:capsular exopolysaccharide synthesis family protein